jgi:hypothetical protein
MKRRKPAAEIRAFLVLAGWPIAAVAAWDIAGWIGTVGVWIAWWPIVIAIELALEARRERHLDRRFRRVLQGGGVVVRGPWRPRVVPSPPLDDPDGGRRADA